MVRRFVKNENVWVLEREKGKGNTRLLTSGEETHLLDTGCTGDTEGTEMATIFFFGTTGHLFRAESDGGVIKVQTVNVMLGEETDTETGVLGDGSAGGCEGSDEELEDGSFTGSVGSDNTDTGIELDVEIDVGNDGVARSVGKADVGHLDDRSRELLHLWELEDDVVFVFWWLQNWKLLQLLDTRLSF